MPWQCFMAETKEDRSKPGAMWYEDYYHGDYKEHYCQWNDCNDPRGHLLVTLPNGWIWDTDSRASNCTKREDKIHRCWVKHGEAPNIHIDKIGHTCAAGAGSILSPDGKWHGFLQNGELVQC